MFIDEINITEMKYPIDEKILNIIDKYFKNFDINEIRKNLINNKYNEGTGLYKILLRKIIDLKINSISDLFSDDLLNIYKIKIIILMMVIKMKILIYLKNILIM